MHDVILTSDDGLHRVIADDDAHPESPRWGAEMGTMVCRDDRYTLGDTGPVVEAVRRMLEDYGIFATMRHLKAEFGTTVVLPLYLYDHTGISISAGPNHLDSESPLEQRGWDSRMVGILFDTAERRGDWAETIEVTDVLLGEVSDYDLFLRGENYLLHVEQKVVAETSTTLTWPDGSVTHEGATTEMWMPVADAMVRSALGTIGFLDTATDMLAELASEARAQ